VLITRPRAAATALAARLGALGHEAVIEPCLAIVEDPDARARLAPALEGCQALLFTSSNGVASFSSASGYRDLRVFAVGDGTAAAARQAGFAAVESAQGDVEALAALLASTLTPSDGPLAHVSGHAVAGDLAGRLGRLGFTVRSVPLYRAIEAEALGTAALAAFRAGKIDAALFFSPRTAATFVRLARAAGIERHCARTAGVALSPAVVAELEGLGWRQILVAEEPTENAVLNALGRLDAELRGSGALNS
jgi:uroporphyrinogen-III synthase